MIVGAHVNASGSKKSATCSNAENGKADRLASQDRKPACLDVKVDFRAMAWHHCWNRFGASISCR